MAKKFPVKFDLSSWMGRGLGSILDHIPASMQLPLLKFMKRIHPIYTDRLISDLAEKYSRRSDFYTSPKNKSERALSSWLFANVNPEAGRDNVSQFPFRLIHSMRKESNKRKPIVGDKTSLIDVIENEMKYMETEDYKYDMSLQDQKRELKEEEILADILEFKKPEKYRGGLISLIS